ncbi:oxygenase MpaB family protein [Gordonia sp. (in: high G+C Gram-positive bacteria)]|uniref:oxygenase MpaB family protein n=1 Tax=Gordonia sp. (in: high G+C Gram-positive bacteria) TaxID=84139 RepID=UPI0039E41CA0
MVTTHAAAPTLADVDFNRRDHEDRPLRPIPPGRDDFADRWRPSREYLFGSWIDIDEDIAPSDFTRARDDMFWQADEHIVPVVDLFEREGSATMRPLFERALTQGIDSVPDAPPELVAFFRRATERPPWLDLKSADRGRILISSASLSAQRLVVGWALFETAMTGDISAATGATGRFKQDSVRRYVETFRMFALATKPDIYDPTTEVFQTITRVRLMHALASRGLRKAWGDEHYLKYGEPIAATSLLAFGNGPLLTRLVDHRLGRRLSARDLDDIAMYAGWFGHLIGAPDRLRARDGQEMIRSLDYVFSRGGDPSGWREELMHTVRQPVDAFTDTYLSWWPGIARSLLVSAGCKGFAAAAIAPLVPVFGLGEVREFVDGAPEFYVSYRLHGELYKRVGQLNARAAGLRDRMPGTNAVRRVLYRNGPPGIDRLVDGMAAFARRYHDIAMAYTHHDGSTSGKGFAEPRMAAG